MGDEPPEEPVQARAENVAEAGNQHQQSDLIVLRQQHAEQDYLRLEWEYRR
jgi:hypothetical protein